MYYFRPCKTAYTLYFARGAKILVANFISDAFYRFFGQSLASGYLLAHPDELVDENCFTELWHALKQLDSSNERVVYILKFCKQYLRERKTDFAKLADLKDNPTVFNPIKVIAGEMNQSERTIQLNHKKYFGYSAKEISRYHRFLRAIELLQQSTGSVDWFEIIHECGYYDQSQLIHDFKHYLNLSPTKFLKFQQDICIANPG